ncbi:hypothetical protein [Clostridium sp. DJ247]|uniref:hypothetical protein n=1 Tax=Clostridium sp. DJ247 TaxID=2726188 RepID=UPI0016272A9F|nr:hypothetical protein [Clostridium sp. DJ247]MBC2580078.1 hypothetical protein [Clostridium sp. DJ247]
MMIYTVTFNPAFDYVVKEGVKSLGFFSNFIKVKEELSRINVKLMDKLQKLLGKILIRLINQSIYI